MVTVCPHCGGDLTAVDHGGDTPPWLCTTCRHGWWNAELTTGARVLWRPLRHDHGYGAPARALTADRDAERIKQRSS